MSIRHRNPNHIHRHKMERVHMGQALHMVRVQELHNHKTKFHIHNRCHG